MAAATSQGYSLHQPDPNQPLPPPSPPPSQVLKAGEGAQVALAKKSKKTKGLGSFEDQAKAPLKQAAVPARALLTEAAVPVTALSTDGPTVHKDSLNHSDLRQFLSDPAPSSMTVEKRGSSSMVLRERKHELDPPLGVTERKQSDNPRTFEAQAALKQEVMAAATSQGYSSNHPDPIQPLPAPSLVLKSVEGAQDTLLNLKKRKQVLDPLLGTKKSKKTKGPGSFEAQAKVPLKQAAVAPTALLTEATTVNEDSDSDPDPDPDPGPEAMTCQGNSLNHPELGPPLVVDVTGDDSAGNIRGIQTELYNVFGKSAIDAAGLQSLLAAIPIEDYPMAKDELMEAMQERLMELHFCEDDVRGGFPLSDEYFKNFPGSLGLEGKIRSTPIVFSDGYDNPDASVLYFYLDIGLSNNAFRDQLLARKGIITKIFYPHRKYPFSVEVVKSELRCLEPDRWLSSNILNFYIRFLEHERYPESNQKFHSFTTFFYPKLQEFLRAHEDDYIKKLRKWWKGVNLFDKTYIFLPVHENKHWSLLIICIREESGALMLHLDSLKGYHDSTLIFEYVKSLLVDEWNCMIQGTADDIPNLDTMKERPLGTIDCKAIEVPQQENGSDCGLFVLYCMERFIQDAPNQMKDEDLSKFDKEWFEAEEASRLRGRLKQILEDEFRKASTST